MIGIVDYGMGNIRSVQSALGFLGADHRLVQSRSEILECSHLILPGVGSFARAVQNMADHGIQESILEAVRVKQRPLLGICLGMQLLATEGVEGGTNPGLDLIPGRVVRLSPEKAGGEELTIPHIGFSLVPFASEGAGPLTAGLAPGADFYFVHSFHLECRDPHDVFGWCEYGGRFVAAVQKGIVFGTQFHPEKSQGNGLRLLRNFLEFGS